MIAIVSPVLAALTVLAVVRIGLEVKQMREIDSPFADSWSVILTTGWLGAIGSSLLGVALMVNNPPQAVWAHPLVWLMFAWLVLSWLFLWAAHNIVIGMRQHDAWLRSLSEYHAEDTRQ